MEQGALTVLDACLMEHADDEDLYNMAVAAFLRIADCGQSPPLSSPAPAASDTTPFASDKQSPLSSPAPAASDATVPTLHSHSIC